MKLTESEKLQLTTKPQKFKTKGAYKLPGEEERRSSYCKCPLHYRIGDWPNNCLSCGRRIRIWTKIL